MFSVPPWKKQQKLLRFHQQNLHNTKASEWNLYRISRIDDAQFGLFQKHILAGFCAPATSKSEKKTTKHEHFNNENALTHDFWGEFYFPALNFWATLHRYIFTNCQPTCTRGVLLDRSLLHLKIFEDLCRNAVARVTWVICPRLRLPFLDLLLAEIHVFSL